MAKPVVGAQMYTVRNSMQTIPDIADSLRKVSEMGYTSVQLSGLGPVEPAELARVVDDSGITVGATHIGWDRFRDEPDAVIEEHKMWNCAHLAIGGLPDEYFEEDGVKRFLDELAPAAERLAAEEMDFSYHNHSRELALYGSRTWLAALYEDGPPDVIKAEIDTYWIQAGGGDPAQWLRKCEGREPVIHLKDMCVLPDQTQRFAEIGEGNLNWNAIMEASEAGGVEYLMVEQDNCYDRDPFESLAISYRNLKAMGYE